MNRLLSITPPAARSSSRVNLVATELRQGLPPALVPSTLERPEVFWSSGNLNHHNVWHRGLTPDGRHLVVVMAGDGNSFQIATYNIEQGLINPASAGATIKVINAGHPDRVAFNNELIVVQARDSKGYLRLFDVETAQYHGGYDNSLVALDGLGNSSVKLHASPDGQHLLVSSAPYTLRLYDLKAHGFPYKTLPNPSASGMGGEGIYTAAFSEDGSKVLCTGGFHGMSEVNPLLHKSLYVGLLHLGEEPFWEFDLAFPEFPPQAGFMANADVVGQHGNYVFLSGNYYKHVFVYHFAEGARRGIPLASIQGWSSFDFSSGEPHAVVYDAFLGGLVCGIYSGKHTATNTPVYHAFVSLKSGGLSVSTLSREDGYPLFDALREPFLMQRDVGQITGTVRDVNNQPAARTVQAFSNVDGRLLGQTVSDAVTGDYQLVVPNKDELCDICFRALDSEDLNDLFFRKVKPSEAEPVPFEVAIPEPSPASYEADFEPKPHGGQPPPKAPTAAGWEWYWKLSSGSYFEGQWVWRKRQTGEIWVPSEPEPENEPEPSSAPSWWDTDTHGTWPPLQPSWWSVDLDGQWPNQPPWWNSEEAGEWPPSSWFGLEEGFGGDWPPPAPFDWDEAAYGAWPPAWLTGGEGEGEEDDYPPKPNGGNPPDGAPTGEGWDWYWMLPNGENDPGYWFWGFMGGPMPW